MDRIGINLPKVLEDIIIAIRVKGGVPYLIGGAVVSLLQRTVTKDFDIEVFHLSYNNLLDCLEGFGKPDLIGNKFGIVKLKVDDLDMEFSVPRRDSKAGLKHKDFDIELVPDLSIEEAARRRDFTINSISIELPNGQIHDPYKGMRDLFDGVLRHVDSDTFRDDPLRTFRALQILARKLKRVAPETIELLKSMVPDCQHISGESIFGELSKLLMLSEKPSVGFELMKETQLVKLFPELEDLIGSKQSPAWHPEGWSARFFKHTPTLLNTGMTQTVSTNERTLVDTLRQFTSSSTTPNTMVPRSSSTSNTQSLEDTTVNSLSPTKPTGPSSPSLSPELSKTSQAKPPSFMFDLTRPAFRTDKSIWIMLKIPLSSMLSTVNTAINDLEILNRIIHPIAINMMDMFSPLKPSVKKQLHKDPMNTNSSINSWPTGIHIPRIIVDTAPAAINNNIFLHLNLTFKTDFNFSHRISLLSEYDSTRHLSCKVEEGDVWTHTMLVVDAAASIRNELPEDWKLGFMWGMLLHDVGKPTTLDKDFHNYRHDKVGIKIAHKFLERLTLGEDLHTKVGQIIQGHMRAPSLVRHRSGKGAWRKLQNICPLNICAYVSMCDANGCGADTKVTKGHDTFKKTMEIYKEMGEPKGRIQGALLGRHLIEAGHDPGPQFGPMLEKAYKFQMKTGCTDVSTLLAIVEVKRKNQTVD